MKLSDLLTGLAPLDRAHGAIEARRHADSRKVKRGDVFVAVPGTKADGFPSPRRRAAAPRRVGERDRRSCRRARFVQVDNAGGRSRCWRRDSIRASRGDRGGDRHQRQDLGRGLHPADLGGARHRGRQRRHHRRRDAEARGLRLADHARSGRPASHAVELAGEGVTHLAIEASSHGLDQHRSTACASRRRASPI
jgi:UDP-N-acetylmuramoyl-L-alanyl-D-glutamate--2,6-diaminopimelate ligase